MRKDTGEFLLVLTLFGTLFLAAVDNQLLIPLLPLLADELSVTMEALGRLFSAYALCAALFNLVVGPLTDRFGRVLFLRGGLLLFALTALGTYLSEGYNQLVLLRAATGLAAAVLSTCTASLVGDFFPYHRRGRVMGMVLSAYFVALIVGVPAGAWVAEYATWHTVFLITFGIAVALLVRTLLFFPANPGYSRGYAAQVMSVYRRLLTSRQTVGGLAVSFAISGATLSFLTFISAHLNRAFQATPVQIAWLFMISGVGAVVGSSLSGVLADRLGKRWVFLSTNTLMAVPLFVLDTIPYGPLLVAAFLTISFLVASRQTALQTVQTQLIPSEERGTFLGLRNGVSQLGISSCVLASTFIFSSFGYTGVVRFAAVLTIAGSLFFYLWVQEPE